MKKRIVVLMMAAFMAVGALTACGGAKNSGSAEAASGAEAGSAEESKFADWTGADWKNASDADKKDCARYILKEASKKTLGAMGKDASDGTIDAAMNQFPDAQLDTVIQGLDTAFKANESMKISECIDMFGSLATQVVDGMSNQ